MCDLSAEGIVIPANLRMFIPWKIAGGGGVVEDIGEREDFPMASE